MQSAPRLGFRCHASTCPLSQREIVLAGGGRCPLCGSALRGPDAEETTQVGPLADVVPLTEARRRKMVPVACRAFMEVKTRSLSLVRLQRARLVAPDAEGRLTHHWIWNCPFRIGRGRRADLMLDGEKISRLHAQIVAHDGGYRLEDLTSSNGTFVNGERIKTHVLADGDEIRTGGTKIIFVVSG